MLDLQARGLSLDQLFTRYLSPAAERLGQMWSDDELTFLQVTLGVGRIYDLVRMLRDHAPPPRVTQAEPVVFASVPGEQHGVGVEMAAELFRQHGWDVKLLIGETHDTILHEIGETRSHVLGLSAGGRASAQPLARLIHAARVAHPHLYIIVSGRIVEAEPDLLALMGPDGAVSTVDEALEMVTRLSGASVQTGD
jgi:methylmalonyl-CoA mutase cobalamin-binding subunit